MNSDTDTDKDTDTKNILLLLKEELELMEKAADILDYSYQKCKKTGVKVQYDYDELERFEALTSRFARLSDILIQKVFRLIDKIDLESEGTVRDRINRAEKKELIESADDFVKIRIVRNQIAHEYIPEEIYEIFKKVLKYTPKLLDSVNRVKNYTEKQRGEK
ncbi:MAG: hypothetical protein GTO45_33105 [Candidatus Aminicenantes bacterium]|nr:hypothetical protein [Candidatus Aminicenantes bacterium]NIM83579.1 hypothetical protein [Candidatus Aminicenantes bacterium]NIN22980.1 hypothetical protein [Candidatus Aminicenantes bacterium]NIN46717.1 hypothetical protein [Candidatus Aminicenantes bacterium]NIN89623.1 hypothetical protein [Candidatus Aminicenantes bacterium]